MSQLDSAALTPEARSASAVARLARLARRHWFDALFAALAIAAVRRMFRDVAFYNEDFRVYWKAAHAWLSGGNPYAFTAADQGFVFKYPPWILPLFLPVGLLSWESARIFWFALELGCVAYAVRWIMGQGVSRHIACFVLLTYWYLMHGHFIAGQFTLLILAACLWAFPSSAPPAGARPESLGQQAKDGAFSFVLSAKVFSLFTLGGAWKRFLRPVPWLTAGALFVGAHALVLWVSARAGMPVSLVQLYRDFAAAASSGGAELGAEIVRGQGNHGLTALILRTLNVSSLGVGYDLLTSGALAVVLGAIWTRHSRALTEAERWAGWIGIGLVVHPLAWHHSFVLAYPLSALALGRAVSTGRRSLVALALFATFCIGVFVPQVIGKTLVKALELGGMKSWGVLLCGASLVLSARAGRRA